MADGWQGKMQIKGIRDGLLVTLGEGSWPDLQATLLKQIQDQASFYQGAKLALDVGNHILKAADLGGLRDQLSDRGVSLWAVISNSPTTEQTARVLGMATRISNPRPERPIRSLDTNLTGENAVLVQRTLRSGFKLTHDGHVMVIGDVNPGAEIIARGSVVIWGRLKGVVHAGAEGDEGAIVCALELTPTQLRIAGHIATTPQRRWKLQPEVARVVNGQVVAEPWNSKSKQSGRIIDR